MSNWPAFRRRRLVVDSRSQYRFIGAFLVQVGLIVAILTWLAVNQVARIQELAATLPPAAGVSEAAVRVQLETAARQFHALALVLVALVVVLLVLCGLFASHKLAGPIYKLKAYLGALAAGTSAAPISFRQKDRLDDFALAINTSLQSADARRAAAGQRLAGLRARATALAATSAAEPAARLLEEMRELLSQLRVELDPEAR